MKEGVFPNTGEQLQADLQDSIISICDTQLLMTIARKTFSKKLLYIAYRTKVFMILGVLCFQGPILGGLDL